MLGSAGRGALKNAYSSRFFFRCTGKVSRLCSQSGSGIISRHLSHNQAHSNKITLADIEVITDKDNDKHLNEKDLTQTRIIKRKSETKRPKVPAEEGEPDDSLTDFYKELKQMVDKFSNRVEGEYVIFTQVGSFYELYFEQAEKYAGLLGITLTRKQLKSQDIPFAGFPDYKLDKYLRLIFSKGLKAVICNQRKDEFNNVITRPIDRLVSPGTVIDESLRDYHRNNHLLAITFPEEPFKHSVMEGKIGLAWCDVSLGTFYVLQTNFENLMAAITRISPSEIVVDSRFDIEYLYSGKWHPQFSDLKSYYITRYQVPSTKKRLQDHASKFADNRKLVLSTFDLLNQKEISASSLLLTYLGECLPNYSANFQLPTRSLPSEVMQIDPRAARDLELTETIRGGMRIGALANIIDRTVTNPGARLLSSWLLMPSTNIKEIKQRQHFITLMLRFNGFTDELIQLLRHTADVSRIIRRIDNNRADFAEYLEISSTINCLDNIYDLIKEQPMVFEIFSPIFEKFIKDTFVHKLGALITKTIDISVTSKTVNGNSSNGLRPDITIAKTNWNIKAEASHRMQKLRAKYDACMQKYCRLHEDLGKKLCDGEKADISLIRHLKTGEFLVNVKVKNRKSKNLIESTEYEEKYHTKTSVKLQVPEWKELGNKMISLENDIATEEMMIIDKLKTMILKHYDSIKEMSPIIELLDTTQSFANMAQEKNLVCPTVDKSTDFDIVDGRHLVVEEGLQDRSTGLANFTSNSCKLLNGTSWVITGPNMGGKSTFLRQNALIAILAQIGSFVPASRARLGIIDKIFTRVGSSDNIFKNQSTFMVEMNEMATILREATDKSLVIVDELGRGTSPQEGVAIAFASLYTMLQKNKSKVLFATHFGTDLKKYIDKYPEVKNAVEFYKTDLEEFHDPKLPIDKRIVFHHSLSKGLSTHSHALLIAELAGFPKAALKIARNNLPKEMIS